MGYTLCIICIFGRHEHFTITLSVAQFEILFKYIKHRILLILELDAFN